MGNNTFAEASVIPAEELPGLLGTVKRHKFGARQVEVNGITFPSEREARRWQTLLILEHQGEITNLRRQVPYELVLKTKYVSDFEYDDISTGQHVVEDSKGFRTREYKRKRKAMAEQYGIEIRET